MNKTIKIGDVAKASKVYTMADIKGFAMLTGDFNPVHLDEDFAAKTIFKKPIVHGPLVLTLITTIFANKLPGPGTIYLSQELKYIQPVYIGDEITAIVEVLEINDKQHIFLSTRCVNQNNNIVIEGLARVKLM